MSLLAESLERQGKKEEAAEIRKGIPGKHPAPRGKTP
jgi:hypothetical protein